MLIDWSIGRLPRFMVKKRSITIEPIYMLLHKEGFGIPFEDEFS